MNRLLKKMGISLVTVATLGAIVIPSSTALADELTTSKQETIFQQQEQDQSLVPVTLFDDGTKVITAQIPEEYANKYKEQLKNQEFLAQEIFKSKLQNRSGETVTLYGIEQVQEVLETIDANFAWSAFLSSIPASDVVIDAAIGAFARAASGGNLLGILAGVMASLASNLVGRETDWWTESALMILRGEISYVKITTTPNLVSEYPAAYTTYERIK